MLCKTKVKDYATSEKQPEDSGVVDVMSGKEEGFICHQWRVGEVLLHGSNHANRY